MTAIEPPHKFAVKTIGLRVKSEDNLRWEASVCCSTASLFDGPPYFLAQILLKTMPHSPGALDELPNDKHVSAASHPHATQQDAGGGTMARNSTRYMESVIALAEKLNFGRAAQELDISQPMLTRNIAELEASLGVQLFTRNHRTVRVTAAGEAYIEKARIALLYGEKAFLAARAVGENAKSVLYVGKSPYTDPALTSMLLSIKLPSYPDLRIELTSQYSYGLTQELIDGGLDLAVVTEPPKSRILTRSR